MITRHFAIALCVASAAEVEARAQQTTLASQSSAGIQGNQVSEFPSMTPDGRFVVFDSLASNLVSGDNNNEYDIFVYDYTTGITERVSVDSLGTEGNRASFLPTISADGRFVAFKSYANNLVAGDVSGWADVFVHDRTTGITERVSVDSSGAESDGDSSYPSISADGDIIAFESQASNLVAGDSNGTYDVFTHDRTTGITERVSVDSTGKEGNNWSSGAAVSGDGRIVAFDSFASNLVSGDSNKTWDTFVHDRTTGATERTSVDSTGAQSNGNSGNQSISADGKMIAFWSAASNLISSDTNSSSDVFVRDRSTGTTERVSIDSSGAEVSGGCGRCSISSNGNFVVFESDSTNLVPGDTNGIRDIFFHDRTTGSTEIVSVGLSGTQSNGTSILPTISTDGQFVVWQSSATNLVSSDSNSRDDAFIRERCQVSASWSNYGTGFPGTNGVPAILPRSMPVFGSSLTVDLANSSGKFTVGLLFVGYQRASIHSALGGDLLVLPSLTALFTLPPAGISFSGDLPFDGGFCGFVIDLQAIESDFGALKGVSFTQGLELILGH